MTVLALLLLAWLVIGGLSLNKGNTWINDYLKLTFNATAIANLADNAATSPLTSLYLSLHTADPGAAGSQTTSETAYTGYARQGVTRNSSGFTVSGQTVQLTSAVSFPAGATTDTDVLMFWAVGTASSGAGKVLYSGPIGVNLGAGVGLNGNNITIPGLTGVSVGDRIVFVVPTGGTIPTGLTAGTVYFVKTLSSDVITVSTTSGGSVVAITGDGQVLAYKVTPITMGGGLAVTPKLAASTNIVTEQ